MNEQSLRQRGLRFASFTIIWDMTEGVVAVTAGLRARSIALVGFGIDSGIAVFAAAVTAWQLRGGAQARQRTVLRLIALSVFTLAAYVASNALTDLLAQEKPDTSIVGILLNSIGLVVLAPVAIIQRRTGRALDNEVLVAQSQATCISNSLSVSLHIRVRPVVGAEPECVWEAAPAAITRLRTEHELDHVTIERAKEHRSSPPAASTVKSSRE